MEWWHVAMMICLVNGGNCYRVIDEKGPFQTRAECEERRNELVRRFVNNLEIPANSWSRCEVKTGA